MIIFMLDKLLGKKYNFFYDTQSPRPGEEDGTDYHFSTREEMKSMMENNEFVENAEFSGNMYGTSKKSIQDVLDNGIQASFFCYFYCQYLCFS